MRKRYCTQEEYYNTANLEIVVFLRNIQLDHIRNRAQNYSYDNLSIKVPTIMMPVGTEKLVSTVAMTSNLGPKP